ALRDAAQPRFILRISGWRRHTRSRLTLGADRRLGLRGGCSRFRFRHQVSPSMIARPLTLKGKSEEPQRRKGTQRTQRAQKKGEETPVLSSVFFVSFVSFVSLWFIPFAFCGTSPPSHPAWHEGEHRAQGENAQH